MIGRALKCGKGGGKDSKVSMYCDTACLLLNAW